MRKNIETGICLTIICLFVFMWGFSGKHGELMTISSQPSEAMDRQVIVIDPGHGGMDGGCISINGTAEKDINLAISKNCKELFTALGFQPICTRETDEAIYDEGVEGLSAQKKSDMENRLAIFSKYTDAISISIHQNQFTDSRYSGAQMFYQQDNTEGERLAQNMQKQFVNLLDPENTRETKPVTDELYLLKNTSCAAIMIECGFLSNPQEAQLLESDEYQKQVSFAIFTGLMEYSLEKT